MGGNLSGPTRLAAGLSAGQGPALRAAAASLILAASGAPILALFIELAGAGPAALEPLASARTWELLARSLLLSSAVTALALSLGIPLGVALARAQIPLPRTVLALHALPAFLPPLLPALGWTHLFGQDGLLGSELTSALLFSELGHVVVLGLTLSPIVTSLTAMGVASIDPSLEDAARLVARPARVAVRILLPGARPAVLTAALLVFSLALGEIGVPMLLRVDVYVAAVFARLGGIDARPGEAAALIAPLVPVALALVALEARFGGRRVLAVLGWRNTRRPRLDFGTWTLPLSLLCAAACVLSVAPLFALGLRAGLAGFADAGDWIGSSAAVSVGVAVACAGLALMTGALEGHALARALPGARAVDTIGVLAFLLPASAVGVGLITVWNREPFREIYGSLAIVVIGLFARYQVVAGRAIAAGVLQMSESFEHAATTVGAGFVQRFTRIVLPMQRRALALGFLLVLAFGLRDLETVVLFYPPDGAPLTVRIFTLEANGPEPVVAALALLHVAITFGALGLFGLFLWPRARIRR